jgi:hypothetical protein
MNSTSMRFVLVLLLVCLVSAIPAMADTGIVTEKTMSPNESWSVSCSGDSYPGLPGGSVIAVVYLSGHGATYIDTQALTPIGGEKVGGNPASWYGSTPGSHSVLIVKEGYTNFIATVEVCSGRVSYVKYDQDAHLYPGTTRKATAATVTTVLPATTTFSGQSTDFRDALAAASGTTAIPAISGSLSVTTEPAGATIFIDGIQQGISPATIPGLTPGTHTLLLKREGYMDLTLPVIIEGGKTQYYSSAMLRSGTASEVTGTAARKSSAPGCEGAVAACVVGALLLCRKTRP